MRVSDMIIFGAGKAANNLYDLISFAGYRVIAVVDNDARKWGKRIRNVEVISPDELMQYSCKVVANDLFFDEIAAQLEKMEYSGQLITKKELLDEIIKRKYSRDCFDKPVLSNHAAYVIDSYFQQSDWGGVESWSCLVNSALRKRNCRTVFLCGNNVRFDNLVQDCIHYCENNEIEVMNKMINDIIRNLPCVCFSHGSIALYSAIIVKGMYHGKIKIVVVAHGDEINTYKRISHWIEYIDDVICISKKIQETFVNDYGIDKGKLTYHMNPMYLPERGLVRKGGKERLKIGFAARLCRRQKRTHLLPQIISECVSRKLDVEFNIAGEGDCFDFLQTYITEHGLGARVHLLGWLQPNEMADFWEKQDIYLNVSDFEGMSLTMLEAMACGAFPVVTDVSGVSDLIEEGKNGFIVPVDKWLACVDKIAVLNEDRELLIWGSTYNMNIIREKCNVEKYAGWLMDTFKVST